MTERVAFVFDSDRCTGCEACRIACGIENNGGRDTGWRSVTTFNPARHPSLPTRHLSLACNHCDVPACALGCPAKAYERDTATGAVILDSGKCIGCRYCSWVCPYDAPRFEDDEGVMTKCTFCAPRLREGREPACTTACPTDALSLGRRNGSELEPAFVGLGAFGLGPALKIVEPRRLSPPPLQEGEDGERPRRPVSSRKLTPRSEWALLVFTIVVPALVAWFLGGFVRADRAPSVVVFTLVAAATMVLSTSHLGKPLRAWRAMLNLRSSWLSREVFFTTFFFGLGVSSLALPEPSRALGIAALVAGVLACISIDGVYRAIPRAGQRFHSAEAIPALAVMGSIAIGVPLVVRAAAVLVALIFVGRWRTGSLGMPVWLGLVRIGLLAIACLRVVPWELAIALALVAHAIDRWAFYAELEPTTPARRMAAAMVARAF